MNKLFFIMILLLCTTAQAQTYTVKRVMSGDTFIVESSNGQEEVLLLGVDVPSFITTDPDTVFRMDVTEEQRDQLQRWNKNILSISQLGKEANAFVKRILPKGSQVLLEFDEPKRNMYGSLLAYVYVFLCDNCKVDGQMGHEYVYKDTKLYIFLNATLIKSGYAMPLPFSSDGKYTDLFQKLYDGARENKRGLWMDLQDMDESDQMDCMMDVKECSDGSYVSRVAPKCEFKPCP